jgi:hypothetical protein
MRKEVQITELSKKMRIAEDFAELMELMFISVKFPSRRFEIDR